MKYLKFLFVGIVFGIILMKSEAVSWYRIYEMFRFESFHMYGIIGSAIITGILLLEISRKMGVKNIEGFKINVIKKRKGYINYIAGGTIFGLGWALAGACPGPIFILIGTGATSMIIVLISAVLGTFVYGLLRNKLPH
ncbi:MAG: YeeE/YedE family protein [Bacteroidia bacterium]|nr:YeeE/YedE family protein [Bacteroidia bacterium]NNK28538.1 YeeE/YedE family protein [Flavobacteriaceae bacterium]